MNPNLIWVYFMYGFHYSKVGVHATNMPSSVYFGKTKGDILSLSENIKYAFDKMGNICRVDENGNAWKWLGWLLTGIVLIGLAVATVLTFGAAAPITGLAATMVTGAMIGGYCRFWCKHFNSSGGKWVG